MYTIKLRLFIIQFVCNADKVMKIFENVCNIICKYSPWTTKPSLLDLVFERPNNQFPYEMHNFALRVHIQKSECVILSLLCFVCTKLRFLILRLKPQLIRIFCLFSGDQRSKKRMPVVDLRKTNITKNLFGLFIWMLSHRIELKQLLRYSASKKFVLTMLNRTKPFCLLLNVLAFYITLGRISRGRESDFY